MSNNDVLILLVTLIAVCQGADVYLRWRMLDRMESKQCAECAYKAKIETIERVAERVVSNRLDGDGGPDAAP